MELVKEQPSTEALELEEPAQAETATWCGKANGECTDGGACLDPDREGAICYDDCESFMAKEWFIAKGDGSGEGLPEVEPGVATMRFPDGTEIPLGHIDRETGEFLGDHSLPGQSTLDPDIFPATERCLVPMVKVGFSGTVEMEQGEWEAYCQQGLKAGRVVKLSLTGYLPDPHSKWTKRTEKNEITGAPASWWELEGQIKIKVLELGSFELRGIYNGE